MNKSVGNLKTKPLKPLKPPKITLHWMYTFHCLSFVVNNFTSHSICFLNISAIRLIKTLLNQSFINVNFSHTQTHTHFIQILETKMMKSHSRKFNSAIHWAYIEGNGNEERMLSQFPIFNVRMKCNDDSSSCKNC